MRGLIKDTYLVASSKLPNVSTSLLPATALVVGLGEDVCLVTGVLAVDKQGTNVSWMQNKIYKVNGLYKKK